MYELLHGTPIAFECCYLLQFDGGASPNPGMGAGGAVLYNGDASRTLAFEGATYFATTTNNQAEYSGLLLGLHSALSMGVKRLVIEGDSMLVIKQLKKEWTIKNESLKEVSSKIATLLQQLNYVGCRHILREKNKVADALTHEARKKGYSFSRLYSKVSSDHSL